LDSAQSDFTAFFLRGRLINLFLTGQNASASATLGYAMQLAGELEAGVTERSPRTAVIALSHLSRMRCEEIAADVLAGTAALAIDCALLPADCRWSSFKLLASDMDSTLITIECIDEIADFCGKRDAVASITEAAMRGEISDFAESLTRRVALLAGLSQSALLRVYDERLRLSPGARELIEAVRDKGIKTLLVSGGFTFFADRVREELGLDRAVSNVLEIAEGRLTGRMLGAIVDGAAKRQALLAMARESGIDANETIVIGDGANDLPMLLAAGLSVAFHAKPAVASACDVSIRFGGLDVLLEWL